MNPSAGAAAEDPYPDLLPWGRGAESEPGVGERELDGLARAGRVVDGADDLDGLASLGTVDERLAAGVDRLEEVGQLDPMALVGDATRVAGAGGEAGDGLHRLRDRGVPLCLVGEVPEGDV